MRYLQIILNTAISIVWLVNGLFCKVLLLVPRHEAIVARILGPEYAREITCCIGIGETLLAAWILSRWQGRLCAIVQIAMVLSMNLIEAVLAQDLLLFGPWNAVFAGIFAVMIAVNQQIGKSMA